MDIPVNKCTTTPDTGLSAVGMKHCGEPEERTKKTTDETHNDGNATSPTDEPYIPTGVGGVEGVTDVLNTSKLVPVRGEP